MKDNGLLKWENNLDIAKMLDYWINHCPFESIKQLKWTMDFGSNEVELTYGLN